MIGPFVEDEEENWFVLAVENLRDMDGACFQLVSSACSDMRLLACDEVGGVVGRSSRWSFPSQWKVASEPDRLKSPPSSDQSVESPDESFWSDRVALSKSSRSVYA